MKKLHLTLLLLLIFVTTWAFATTAKNLTLSDLVKDSNLITIGKITNLKYTYDKDKGMVYTIYTLEVTDSLKGTSPRQIKIKLPGGTYKGVVQVVSGTPKIKIGEKAVLFLTKWNDIWTPVGLAQGVFFINQDTNNIFRRMNKLRLIGKTSHFPSTLKDLKTKIIKLIKLNKKNEQTK